MIKDIQDIIWDLLKFMPTLLWITAVLFLITFIGYTVFHTYGYKIFFILIFAILFVMYTYFYYQGYSIKALKSYTKELLVSIVLLSAIGLFLELALKGDELIKNTIGTKVIQSPIKNSKTKYANLSIEGKITFLHSIGLSKEQIKNKLSNNMEFKQLINNDINYLEKILSKVAVLPETTETPPR